MVKEQTRDFILFPVFCILLVIFSSVHFTTGADLSLDTVFFRALGLNPEIEFSSALLAGGVGTSLNSGTGAATAIDLRWGVPCWLGELGTRGELSLEGTDDGEADMAIDEEVSEPERVGVRADLRFDFFIGVGKVDSPLHQPNVSQM
jgi:hypothetical protein